MEHEGERAVNFIASLIGIVTFIGWDVKGDSLQEWLSHLSILKILFGISVAILLINFGRWKKRINKQLEGFQKDMNKANENVKENARLLKTYFDRS